MLPAVTGLSKDELAALMTEWAQPAFRAGHIFLLGIDALLEAVGDPRLDPESRAERAAAHTRLLYMATTRAARRLVIFSERWR